jgi:hypothetical protein
VEWLCGVTGVGWLCFLNMVIPDNHGYFKLHDCIQMHFFYAITECAVKMVAIYRNVAKSNIFIMYRLTIYSIIYICLLTRVQPDQIKISHLSVSRLVASWSEIT